MKKVRLSLAVLMMLGLVLTIITPFAKANDHQYPQLTVGKDKSERNFTWYHQSDAQGYIQIAESNDAKDFSQGKTIKGETHQGSNAGPNYTQVTMPDLKQNTTYMYRYYNGENGEKSEVRHFETHDDGNTSFIAVADPQLGASGDLGSDIQGWQHTLSQMPKLNDSPNFLLSLGDQVNWPDDEDAYAGFIEQKDMEKYALAPTVGNHDALNRTYSEHFKVPNKLEHGQTPAGSNYFFVQNHTLFINLNVESTNYREHEATIQKALEATKDQDIKWKVAVYHRGPFSAGKHSNTLATKDRRQHLAPMMNKYGMDLVLNGHDHSYARSHVMNGTNPDVKWDENGDAPSNYQDPEGPIYITMNSTSGSKFYDLVDNHDYLAKRDQSEKPSFTRVDIDDQALKVKSYFVPEGDQPLGEPMDEVTIQK